MTQTIEEHKAFKVSTYTEAITLGGTVVTIICHPDDKGKIQTAISNCRDIDIHTNHKVNVSHGGYGRYSRYELKQHKYAGGSGYIEVLEIKDPPDNRCGFVLYECFNDSKFSEWKTLKDAIAAFELFWGAHDTIDHFPKLDGFIRFVQCGPLVPWFYAVGEEELVGDYAVPRGLTDHPVYRLGRKFVVYDEDNNPGIKICLGSRYCKKTVGSIYSLYREPQDGHIVYWDDGSTWREDSSKRNPPRLLEDNELWIIEATRQFNNLLGGKTDKGEITLLDGSKIIIKVKENQSKFTKPGMYYVRVVRNYGKTTEGQVDFNPTEDAPDVLTMIKQVAEGKSWKLREVRIQTLEDRQKGRKWQGVFFGI